MARLVRGLAEYERKLHEVTATEADLAALLFGTPVRAHAVLAEPADEQPAGLALFYYTASTFSGRCGIFLEDLFVEPAWRGKGLGKALLTHLAVRAVAENRTGIEWKVLNWNEPSIRFYESLGATKMVDWHVRQLHGAALRALAEGKSHG